MNAVRKDWLGKGSNDTLGSTLGDGEREEGSPWRSGELPSPVFRCRERRRPRRGLGDLDSLRRCQAAGFSSSVVGSSCTVPGLGGMGVGSFQRCGGISRRGEGGGGVEEEGRTAGTHAHPELEVLRGGGDDLYLRRRRRVVQLLGPRPREGDAAHEHVVDDGSGAAHLARGHRQAMSRAQTYLD